MKLRIVCTALTALLVASGGLTGCGGGSSEGDLPPANKQLSKEDADKIAKQVKEGMTKSGYKGAPGAPPPK